SAAARGTATTTCRPCTTRSRPCSRRCGRLRTACGNDERLQTRSTGAQEIRRPRGTGAASKHPVFLRISWAPCVLLSRGQPADVDSAFRDLVVQKCGGDDAAVEVAEIQLLVR